MAKMSTEERRARRKARREAQKASENNLTLNIGRATAEQTYINNEDWFTISVEGHKKTIKINKGGRRNKKWSIIGYGIEHINIYDKRGAIQKAAELIVKEEGHDR